MSQKYYVYELYDPRKPKNHPKLLPNAKGRLFYVGKGKNNRINVHEEIATKPNSKRFKTNIHLYNKIKHILEQNMDIIKVIIAEFQQENEAEDFEKLKIYEYGLTNLCNKHVGGRGGSSGRIFSEETRLKMSQNKKGKPLKQTHKNNISQSIKGNNHPMFGKNHSIETKIKISKSLKGNIPWNKNQLIELPVIDIIKMKQDGFSNQEIANKYNVSSRTIRRRVKQYKENKRGFE